MGVGIFKSIDLSRIRTNAYLLLGRPPALGPLNDSLGAAITLLLCGLFLLWGGVNVWRRCRRRMRRQHGDELSLSPQLLKKRD